MEYYNLASIVAPEYSDAYFRKAEVFIKQGDSISALNELDKAIKIQPDKFEYYLLVDRVRSPQKSWPEIIVSWNKYLALQPKDHRAYFERSGTHIQNGNLALAAVDAQKAADLGNPNGQKLYEAIKARSK